MGAPYWHLERMHDFTFEITVVYRLYKLMFTVYYKILQDSQYVVYV